MKISHRIAAIATFLALGASMPTAHADPVPAEFADAGVDPAVIHVAGDTVFYRGYISAESTKAFKAAVGNLRRGDVTRLVISSVGGETRNGREIGRWVHDMALIVEVDRVCFSSCANYIFPAGRARAIRANGLVGWHGNERGVEISARKRGVSVAAQIRSMLPEEALKGPPEKVQERIDEALPSLYQTMREEADYFARLGLRDDFAVCAVADDAPEKHPALRGKKGWGFSVKDMERLGLVNTFYLGDGTYEKDSKLFRQFLGLLGADECLQLLSENRAPQ